nr:FAD-binding oxidoreductase [Nitrosomonas nitrosa]
MDTCSITINVTGRQKSVPAILKPTNIEEVRKLVLSARSSGTPIYPFSKGYNWGYGSRSPVSENCALIDLGNMNKILNAESISLDNPIAIIEPGVTQIQLYNFLQTHAPNLIFNVTGSGKDTSIIGNALDRGVGYMGPRRNDLFGLEIVTGTGEILRTGFRRLGDSSPLAQNHPFGLGPILDGLFFQSNFGIVTSACFRLFPKRPKEIVISLPLCNNEDLPLFIDELAHLKREGLLTSVTHIANRARSNATLSFGITSYLEKECNFSHEKASIEADKVLNIVTSGEWTSLASITGTHLQVKAALREIRSRMRRFGHLKVVNDELLNLSFKITHSLRFLPFVRRYAAAISAMYPLHRLALGTPTDIAIESLLWKFDHPNRQAPKLDESRCGLLFINPALPLNGSIVSETIEGMKSIAKYYNHLLYITINIETETSLVAIVNLLFDRSNPEEIEKAHSCADALLSYIRSKGLEVYRARADMMNKVIATDTDYWKKIYSLKQVFDPDNIIAPGRYNLP